MDALRRRLLIAALILFALANGADARPRLILQDQNARWIEALAFSPDGCLLASGGADGAIRLWDTARERILATHLIHGYRATALAFSPDGKLLACGAADGRVLLLDVATATEVASLAAQRSDMTSVAFRPDGRLLATAGQDDNVRLWDLPSGRLRATLPNGFAVTSVAFSPDGRLLASASGQPDLDSVGPQPVKLWDVASAILPEGTTSRRRAGAPTAKRGILRATLVGHQDSVTGLCFTQDGKTLVSASVDRTVRLWDLPSGRLRRTLRGHGDRINAVAVDARGDRVASGGEDRSVRLWSAASGRLVRTLDHLPDHVLCLAFSPRGRTLAIGGVRTAPVLWDLKTGRRHAFHPPYALSVTDLQFSGDGRTLVTDGFEGVMTAWDLATGIPRYQVGSTRMPRLTPDGRYYAVGRAHAVTLRDLETGRMVRHMSAPARVDGIEPDPQGRRVAVAAGRGVTIWSDGRTTRLDGQQLLPGAFSPDGKTMATAEGGLLPQTLRLWDAATGTPRATLRHPVPVERVAFSADGRTLASAGRSPDAWLWDARTGRRIAVLAGHRQQVACLAFSPRAPILATGSFDESVRLWDAATGRPLRLLGTPVAPRRIEGAVPFGDYVRALRFSPDGRILAAQGDETVRLFDVASGKLRTTLRGGGGLMRCAAFSPDGRFVATAGWDAAVSIWEASSGTLLATVASLDGGDWIAVSPQGFFDGSPRGMRSVLWRLSPDIFDVAEPEQYFNEFYQPGLLADVLREGKPVPEILRERGDRRASLRIERQDRRLPILGITAPRHAATRTVRIRLRLADGAASPARPTGCRSTSRAPHRPRPAGTPARGSGIRDVRLFRNGTLVALWRGFQRSGERAAEVTMLPGRNVLTAYAFNRDNVKSKDATAVVMGAASLRRRPRAWILGVGIDRYSDPSHDLRFAGADARGLACRLAAVLPFPSADIHVATLLDARATRAGIVAALRHLAAVAQPEDTAIISFSGHGLLYRGHFYLVPHNLGRAATAAQLARRGLSDRALEPLLLRLQAEHAALILDACHSGQALASDDWRRGPMNARGLVQLAWEKGMDVLAASQSQQAALEAWQVGSRSIGNGLLTYALVEGLRRRPGLQARQWLDEAAARVPELLEAGRVRGRDLVLTASGPRPVQIPRAFHRREGGDWVVAR